MGFSIFGFLGFLFCLMVSFGLGGCTSAADHKISKPDDGAVAYVMQRKPVGSDRRFFLTQVDLKEGRIAQEIRVKRPYSYGTWLPDGDVLLTYSRDATSLKRVVDRYDARRQKVKAFIKTKGHYPSVVLPYGDVYYVLMDAHSSGDLALEKFDRSGDYLKTVLLAKHAMCLYGAMAMAPDGKTLWLVVDQFKEDGVSETKVVAVDLDTDQVSWGPESLGLDVSDVNSVALDVSQNILYVAASVKAQDVSGGPSPVNHEVYLYQFPSLNRIKTIPIGHQPDYLVLFPEAQRLYVSYGVGVKVIDTHTHLVIETLPFFPKRMEKVSASHLMIWHQRHRSASDRDAGNPPSSPIEDKLVVVAAKTGQVLTELEGHFGPIVR